MTTQGTHNNGYTEYVTTYTLQRKATYASSFSYVTYANGNTIHYVGNSDTTSWVTNTLPDGVFGVSLRLIPTNWAGHITLRWHIFGCNYL